MIDLRCRVAFAVFISRLPEAFAELVRHLPSFGAPPTLHHSGFVEVDKESGTNLFYYLVESQSYPEADPVIWWMNGGPGASSLIGLFSENGPLILNEDQQLFVNPYAWNRHANLLFVEFGPGIGYSFCANSSRSDIDCPQHRTDCSPCGASDSSTTQQNVAFIETFLKEVHPQFAGRPLFLTGESYAGIYVPTLAAAIIEHFEDTSIVNLAGIWVTDPCTDNWAQSGWLDMSADFCYHQGIITRDVYDAITDPMLGCIKGRSLGGDNIRRTNTHLCRWAWRLYDVATAGAGGSVNPRQIPNLPSYLDPLNSYGAAGEVDIAAYLSRGDVRDALSAKTSPNKVYHTSLGNNGYINYVREHQACGDVHGIDGPSVLDVYHQILNGKANGLASASNLHSIIISSGEDDPVVAMEGTEMAVRALGLPEVPGGPRRPWFYNSTALPMDILAAAPVQWGQGLRARGIGVQVGGFVTDFAPGVDGLSFMFVTVRNSGHMVPTYAPDKAYNILERSLLWPGNLAPSLPTEWADMDDGTFYGWDMPEGGVFSHWARSAMAQAATGPVAEILGARPIASLELQSVSFITSPSANVWVSCAFGTCFGAAVATILLMNNGFTNLARRMVISPAHGARRGLLSVE